MTVAHIAILSALLIDAAYGFIVYLTNTRRVVNQQYFLLTLTIGGWMGCVWVALNAILPEDAEFWIRQASVLSALVPTSFNLLRMAIKYPSDTWVRSLLRAKRSLAVNILIAFVCQTQFFMDGVGMRPSTGEQWVVAEPAYSYGFTLFTLYFIGYLGWLIIAFVRDARRARGMQLSELQFLFLGCGVCIATGVGLAIVIPTLTGSSITAPLAPLSVVFLNGIIAYGIATRRILDVANVLRRATSYVLLTAYLVVLYFATFLLSRLAIRPFLPEPTEWPHLLAAIAVAFSLAPVHGRMQQIAKQFFISLRPVDVGEIVQNASQVFHAITTMDDLLQRFASVVVESMGADRMAILLHRPNGFEQVYGLPEGGPALRMDEQDSIIRVLKKTHQPFSVEGLQRQRRLPLMADAAEAVFRQRCVIAIGIYSKRAVEGVMLLGPRLTGRIYGALEQDALQIICNELAVALENASLYTEAQNSKIYNDTLLDNLVSGVIAANKEHDITVFNREAQRMTQLSSLKVLGRSVDVLPDPLARIMRDTIATGHGSQDVEVEIPLKPENVHIRVGSALFHSHAGDPLGVLLVLYDLTAIRKLEDQIRRSDRLASMGTLSAGMAHEIKNPLVTIKTFTQLLPERFDDPDFRQDFVSLVGQEVKRIDSIVNQLLSFARPSKPVMSHTSLHDVVTKSARLVEQEFHRKSIRSTLDLSADDDHIMGDEELLSQAFVNFFLNSLDAMQEGGELSVITSCVRPPHPHWGRESAPKTDNRLIQIAIQDTGEGISTENLSRIFDPFFTTKSNGTGLGLAVSHRIVQEHGGTIDVESIPAKGTRFQLRFPLVKKEDTA